MTILFHEIIFFVLAALILPLFLAMTGTHTGGVSVSTMTTAAYPEGADESLSMSGENMITKLLISGKATSEKVDELFSIFKLILTDARFDSKSKVIELLRRASLAWSLPCRVRATPWPTLA